MTMCTIILIVTRGLTEIKIIKASITIQKATIIVTHTTIIRVIPKITTATIVNRTTTMGAIITAMAIPLTMITGMMMIITILHA